MSSVSATDARGVTTTLAAPPRRIVSLVPSTTESLHALGLADRVVGVTRFCVRPQPWVKGVAKVGGTKDVDVERVRALEPDLVVGNCEENTLELFEALQSVAPLWAPLPRTVDEAVADLRTLGRLTFTAARADALADDIEAARAALRAHRPPPWTYAYLIWRRPWMAVSDRTFIAAMLAEAGGRNVLTVPAGAPSAAHFPELAPDALVDARPDRVLLSSEPFPFKVRHRDELAHVTGWGADRFAFVDGELASWHGVRMAEAFRTWAQRGVGRGGDGSSSSPS